MASWRDITGNIGAKFKATVQVLNVRLERLRSAGEAIEKECDVQDLLRPVRVLLLVDQESRPASTIGTPVTGDSHTLSESQEDSCSPETRMSASFSQNGADLTPMSENDINPPSTPSPLDKEIIDWEIERKQLVAASAKAVCHERQLWHAKVRALQTKQKAAAAETQELQRIADMFQQHMNTCSSIDQQKTNSLESDAKEHLAAMAALESKVSVLSEKLEAALRDRDDMDEENADLDRDLERAEAEQHRLVRQAEEEREAWALERVAWEGERAASRDQVLKLQKALDDKRQSSPSVATGSLSFQLQDEADARFAQLRSEMLTERQRANRVELELRNARERLNSLGMETHIDNGEDNGGLTPRGIRRARNLQEKLFGQAKWS